MEITNKSNDNKENKDSTNSPKIEQGRKSMMRLSSKRSYY